MDRPCSLRALDGVLRNIHRAHPGGQFLGGLAQARVRAVFLDHGWVMAHPPLRTRDVAELTAVALTLHDAHPTSPS